MFCVQICVLHVPSIHGGQKKVSGTLELELEGNYQEGAWN